MLKFSAVISIAFTLLQIHACKPEKKNNTSEFTDTIYYALKNAQQQNLQITSLKFSGVVSSQTIFCDVTLRNDHYNFLEYSPKLWELQGIEGSRATPVYVEPEKLTLQKNQSAKIKLIYQPVHSRYLFQQTGLRGDIDQNYILKINANAFNGEAITEVLEISADAKVYKAVIDSFGLKKTTTPYILAGFDEKHHVKNSGKPDFADSDKAIEKIQITDNEILNNGLWIKVSSYFTSDTLNCNFRIVNQSGTEVYIDVLDLRLIDGSEMIRPSRVSKDSIIELKSGSRSEIILKYPVLPSVNYSLNLSGFHRKDKDAKHSKLFHLPFLLKEIEFSQPD